MKQQRLALLFFFIGYHVFASAQNWPVIIGDNISTMNASIIEDYDKGYLLCNWNKKSPTFTHYGWIVKTDINGNILWNKTFGDGNYSMYFSGATRTTNNDVLISGSIGKYDNTYNKDPLFMKLNACGEVEWCTVLHKAGSIGNDYGIAVIELPDSGYIGMVKYYGHQIQTIRISLVKLDAQGVPLWIRHLAQEDTTILNEEGYELVLTSNSNYLVAGHCLCPGLRPYFIMTDEDGEELWSLKWDSQNLHSGSIEQIIEKGNGVFYASGGGKYGYYMHPALYKFDADGNEIYHHLILGDTIRGGGSGPLALINDTTFAIGYNWNTNPNPNYGNSGIATIDTLGNIINKRLLVEQTMEPANIIKTFDGKIVVTGHYYLDGNWDTYMWKMNKQLEDDSVNGEIIAYDTLCPYQITSDTTDLNCMVYTNVDIDEIPTKGEYENPLKVFPNPASKKIQIEVCPGKNQKIRIVDFTGSIVLETTLPETGKLTFDISNQPHGIYFISLLRNGIYVSSKKLLIK